jgi:PAS domain-containing protein
MSVLDEEPDSLLMDWWNRSPNLKLISQIDGTIEEANDAFCRWSNYTIHEFKRRHNPVLWTQMTLADESLEADVEMAKRCLRGDVEAYQVQKHYIPKGEMPKLCELNIMRYPREGGEAEFKCFLVDVRPLASTEIMIVEAITKIQQGMIDLADKVEHMATIGNAIQWAKENKWASVPMLFLFVYLLFGRSAIEITSMFWKGTE